MELEAEGLYRAASSGAALDPLRRLPELTPPAPSLYAEQIARRYCGNRQPR